MDCRLCKQEKKLIEAHIIPRSFLELFNDGSGPVRIGSNKAGTHPKRSPIGAYDPQLVCESCEAIFSPWDDYAKQVLFQPYEDSAYICYDNQRLAYILGQVDYSRLKLFFASLLWRASASKHEFFSRVQLGRFEDLARQMILTRNPGDPHIFSVCLSRFEHRSAAAMLNPDRTRVDGLNFYRFYFGGYIAFVKVDQMKTRDPLETIQLAPDRPLVVILREFGSSKELPIMKDLARAIANHGKKH